MAGWRLEHTYEELPQLFYSDAAPTVVREPRLAAFNRPLAIMLGLEPDALDGPEGAAIFAGNAMPDGGHPIAQAYAGHQYGRFTTWATAVRSCSANRSHRPAIAWTSS